MELNLNWISSPKTILILFFSAFGEEFGFMGVLFLISLYVLATFRGMSISIKATDNFSRILSGTLILTIFLYACECRYGYRYTSDCRRSVAIYELWRNINVNSLCCAGYHYVYQIPPKVNEKVIKNIISIIFLISVTFNTYATSQYNTKDVNNFIEYMVDEHNFEENDLRELFANIKEERKLKKFLKKLLKTAHLERM